MFSLRAQWLEDCTMGIPTLFEANFNLLLKWMFEAKTPCRQRAITDPIEIAISDTLDSIQWTLVLIEDYLKKGAPLGKFRSEFKDLIDFLEQVQALSPPQDVIKAIYDKYSLLLNFDIADDVVVNKEDFIQARYDLTFPHIIDAYAYFNDHMLAVAMENKCIGIWNSQGETLQVLQIDQRITFLLGTNEGCLLIGTADNGRLDIWDPTNPNSKFTTSLTIENDHQITCSLLLSHTNPSYYFAYVSGRSVWITNKEFAYQKILIGHSNFIKALASISNGMLVSASLDGTIRVWDLSKFPDPCTMVIRAHPIGITTLIALPDDTLISGSYDETIRMWNPKTGQQLLCLTGAGFVTSLVYREGVLFSGTAQGVITAWDLRMGECLPRKRDSNAVEQLSNSPTGKLSYKSGRHLRFMPPPREQVASETEAQSSSESDSFSSSS